MKVMVTGGAGFVGSHLVSRLIEKGHEVYVIDDMSGSRYDNLCDFFDKIEIMYQWDCRDFEQMKRIFRQCKPDVVYHLAANAAEQKAQFSPVDVTSRNYDAFIKVLTAAIETKIKRFIFTSSIAVYGGGQTPFKEAEDPQPEDLYGISKLAAEQSLKVMSKVHGFEYVIARPHNVYGPKQNIRDPFRNVVTIFMNAMLRNEPYYIYGDGEQRRCFSYIDDVADALYACLDAPHGMTFNVGADKDYSLNELANTLQAVTGNHQAPSYLPARVQEVHQATADHGLAKSYLSYQDTTSLLEGLQKTWEWVLEIGPYNPVYTDIELPSPKMPKNWK